MSSKNSKFKSIKIWDLPVRVFHWALAIMTLMMFGSAKTENFDIHILIGQCLVGLIIARICWGFIGSSNTRFSSFVFKPKEYLSYIRKLKQKKPSYQTGHSPIGSLAVILILVALVTQATTGLIASDVDGLYEGPFAYYVTYELSRWASEFHVDHERWLLVLIIAHLLANAFYYFYKKDNLVRPMLSGSKQMPQSLEFISPQLASTRRGIVVALIVAVALVGIYSLYG